jgi:protein phosphatase
VPTIELPDPSLVVLVGAAGSGKSTFAARHFDPDEVLSSDAFRALVSGDEADQRATRPAFAILHRELTRRLVGGRLTVVDATSVLAHARLALVRRSRQAGVPAVALVLDLPSDVVHRRNASRIGRSVKPAVVEQQLALVRAAVDDGRIRSEGFDAVIELRTIADVDAVRVVRRARQPG